MTHINLIKFFWFISCLSLFNISCSDSNKETNATVLDHPSFTFHQNTNKLYFSVNAPVEHGGNELDSVTVNWFSVTAENPPDVILLNDDGLKGDILSNDQVYSLKIINDVQHLINPLISDTGIVFMEYHAFCKDAAGNHVMHRGVIAYQNWNNIEGIRIYPSTGTIDNGTYELYGF